jgi:hypothetical protein
MSLRGMISDLKHMDSTTKKIIIISKDLGFLHCNLNQEITG